MPARTRAADAERDLVALLVAARQGDELAWSRLVDRLDHVPRIVARSFRLAPADAEDVVQSTWLALFKNIDQIREPAAASGWIATVGRREALRLLQRPLRERLTDDPGLGSAIDVPGPLGSSDPLVTSVGGTQLHLDASGVQTAPDNVWNDTALSSIFSRPIFQRAVGRVVGMRRGTPDISMSAAVDGGALVYLGFEPGGAGYGLIGGTSEASPMFSGVVAVADQAAGHRLGAINSYLYLLGALRAPGIGDVTLGTNTVTFPQDGQTITVNGFDAAPGYDLSSGLGTVDGAALVNALARLP